MNTRAVAALSALVVATACGGSSTSPSPAGPVVPAPPSNVTFSGHLTATNGGGPLTGVSVDLGGIETTTAADGAFSCQFQPGTTSRLSFSSDTIVPRSLVFSVSQPRTVDADAIALSNGFDLAYYRRLIRNNYDAPGTMQPLWRWTTTPSIYLKTVDEAGQPILTAFLDQVEAIVKDVIPRWTSGVLGRPVVERGADTREGVSGWITIKFPGVGATDRCGRAQVAVDGGWVELEYHVPDTSTGGCRVPGYIVAPRTIRHEVGHALGFYHTGDSSDLMYGGIWQVSQADAQPTPHEVQAAAIAYHRTVGNVDPDSDPSAVVNLAPLVVR